MCEWCSFRSSFTSRSAILNLSNIRCVPVKTPRFERDFLCYFIATERILIGVQIGDHGVKEHLKLHLLRIDHVMIRYELENLIGATYIGTAKWNRVPGSNPAKKPRVYVRSG
jgi:hypothetical protein